MVIFIGLVIAISSATQDITIDALRIEQIGEGESASMAAGAAVAVVGWWTGFKLGGMIAGLIVFCNIALLMIPEVSSLARQQAQLADQQKLGSAVPLPGFASWFASTILSPMTSFFSIYGQNVDRFL